MPAAGESPPPGRADLRMPAVGAAAWVGALLGHGVIQGVGPLPRWLSLLTLAVVLVAAPLLLRPGARLTGLGLALVLTAVLVSALLRGAQVTQGPVASLAEERAVVEMVGVLSTDPRVVPGRFEEQVLVRIEVREISGRGVTYRLRSPVLVIADQDWLTLPLGSMVRSGGRLSPARDGSVSAVLGSHGHPELLSRPDLWWRGAAAVRSAIRESVAHRPVDQRVLVPSLVNGDDQGLDPDLAADFRATGLTHLLAVSGTNLTLLVGFLLTVARWAGVRGRGRSVVGALGIIGFVLLARTEPSVVRAAAMGTVGLIGLGANGRQRGLRALGVAVTCLLIVGPGWAVTPGFALSVLATAGILVLAPGWRDAMAEWMPRWLAEAIAVPAAAQLACTPLVAAISGQVSVVAVLANLLVAPVVGPATVLGLLGGLVSLIWVPGGQLVGTLAGWCVGWIVLVARWGADLPTAAFDWPAHAWSILVLTVVVIGLAALTPYLLRHRLTGVGCCLGLLLAGFVQVPDPGWPPPGWVLVACNVGQGDALVLRTGAGTAVVVDAGPDSTAVDRCLDRLAIQKVPLVVLTHFHADHIDGLAGVLEGREVSAIETSPYNAEEPSANQVRGLARGRGIPVSAAQIGSTRQFGSATVQVLGPLVATTAGPVDQANDSSVVLLIETEGVRILLTGDVEPEGQRRLARAVPELKADVLKLPHHGSRFQDASFLAGLDPRLVLVSVGDQNTYGHPSEEVLGPFEEAGVAVLRTDRDGDLAMMVRKGELDWSPRP